MELSGRHNKYAKRGETGTIQTAPITRSGHADRVAIQVRAVDFAAYMLSTLRLVDDDLVMLKLDVEGREYELLSRLLLSGALCAVDFLEVEWHLNKAPKMRRLGALGLKLGLGALLDDGCASRTARAQIKYEEFRPQNFGYVVPGLLDEAVRHTPVRASGRLPHLGIEYDLTLNKSHGRHTGLTLINDM